MLIPLAITVFLFPLNVRIQACSLHCRCSNDIRISRTTSKDQPSSQYCVDVPAIFRSRPHGKSTGYIVWQRHSPSKRAIIGLEEHGKIHWFPCACCFLECPNVRENEQLRITHFANSPNRTEGKGVCKGISWKFPSHGFANSERTDTSQYGVLLM